MRMLATAAVRARQLMMMEFGIAMNAIMTFVWSALSDLFVLPLSIVYKKYILYQNTYINLTFASNPYQIFANPQSIIAHSSSFKYNPS